MRRPAAEGTLPQAGLRASLESRPGVLYHLAGTFRARLADRPKNLPGQLVITDEEVLDFFRQVRVCLVMVFVAMPLWRVDNDVDVSGFLVKRLERLQCLLAY
jgi:hypothetical protein